MHMPQPGNAQNIAHQMRTFCRRLVGAVQWRTTRIHRRSSWWVRKRGRRLRLWIIRRRREGRRAFLRHHPRKYLRRVELFSRRQFQFHSFRIWYAWQRTHWTNERVVVIADRQLHVMRRDRRTYVMLRSGGLGCQPELMGAVHDLCESAPTSLFIDVGANYGEFVAWVAPHVEKTIAVEPMPEVFHMLQRSFSDNSTVHTVPIALADSPSQLEIFYRPGYSGGSSFSRDIVANIGASFVSRRSPTMAHVVDVSTLDRLLAAMSIDVRGVGVVLKIDVEGFEQEVLRGAQETLERAAWWRAFVEFNQATLRQRGLDPAAVWDDLKTFPGTVVRKRSDVREMFIDTGRPLPLLPAEAPRVGDVCIGQGTTRGHGVPAQ